MVVQPEDWQRAEREGKAAAVRQGHHLVIVKSAKAGKARLRWDDGQEVEFVPRDAKWEAEWTAYAAAAQAKRDGESQSD